MIEIYDETRNLQKIDLSNKNLLSEDLTGSVVLVELNGLIEPNIVGGLSDKYNQIKENYIDFWQTDKDGKSYIRCYLIEQVSNGDFATNQYIGVVLNENMNEIVKWSVVELDATTTDLENSYVTKNISLHIFGFGSSLIKDDVIISSDQFCVRILVNETGNNFRQYLRNKLKEFDEAKYYFFEKKRERDKASIVHCRKLIDELSGIRRKKPFNFTEMMYWKAIEYQEKIFEIKKDLYENYIAQIKLENLWFNNIRRKILKKEIIIKDYKEVRFLRLDEKYFIKVGENASYNEIKNNELFVTIEKNGSNDREGCYDLYLFQCHGEIKIDMDKSMFPGVINSGILKSCEFVDCLTVSEDEEPLISPVEESIYNENDIPKQKLSVVQKYQYIRNLLKYLK